MIFSCTTSLNTKKLPVLHTQCICFRMVLRINSSYFPLQYYSYWIYNWQWMCFLCGTDWIFVQKNTVFMFLNFAFSVISCTSLYDMSQIPLRTVFSRFYPIFRWSPQKCKVWLFLYVIQGSFYVQVLSNIDWATRWSVNTCIHSFLRSFVGGQGQWVLRTIVCMRGVRGSVYEGFSEIGRASCRERV